MNLSNRVVRVVAVGAMTFAAVEGGGVLITTAYGEAAHPHLTVGCFGISLLLALTGEVVLAAAGSLSLALLPGYLASMTVWTLYSMAWQALFPMPQPAPAASDGAMAMWAMFAMTLFPMLANASLRWLNVPLVPRLGHKALTPSASGGRPSPAIGRG